ncbi:hypothetical protein, partial [Helicobacter typhlonius]
VHEKIYKQTNDSNEKEKEGKKRMKAIGRVELPQEAFLAVLKIDS